MQQAIRSSMQRTCTVRPAQPGDYDKIADLAGQLGYPSTGRQVRVRLDEMQDANHYVVYVAQLSEGRVAGWIGVHIFRVVEADRCAAISGFVVDQSIRSRGIGKALLDAAEKWARSHGCGAISVLSNVKRDRAHCFYKNNGYTHVKTQHAFRKDLYEVDYRDRDSSLPALK